MGLTDPVSIMILVAAALIVAASVPLAGGRIGDLAKLHFAGSSLLAAALAVQVAVLVVLDETIPTAAAAALHVASYVLAGAFVWRNRRVPGLWLVAVGGAANAAAIAANGGVMPASSVAQAAAGIHPSDHFANSAVVTNPRLSFLGDVFAWPEPLPLANVFSVGDVALLVGAAVLMHRAAGSRLTFRRRPATAF